MSVGLTNKLLSSFRNFDAWAWGEMKCRGAAR